MFFATALIAALASTTAHAAPKTVCTITINSANERQAFMRSLPPGDFRFVELTDFDPKPKNERGESQWFEKACASGIQCDILVDSAHFGGLYFGESYYRVTVPQLESNSCLKTCDGILKHPKEVFLFGCNTLAEKNKDSRTQQQYIEVLVKDGYRADLAAQVAETRYGAVGSTFKDQARRMFAGVPHIYGFPSVGPSGANVSPALNRYFQSIPDYAAHLDQMATTTAQNTELEAAIPAMTQTSGVGTLVNDAGVPYRNQICKLYETETSIVSRTKTIVQMLQSEDRFIYLNSVIWFLNQHITEIQFDSSAIAILMNLKNDATTMAAFDKLNADSTTSTALKLDLMELDLKLGRISRAQFRSQALALVKPLLSNLTQAHADALCTAIHGHNLRMQVAYEDLGAQALSRVAALYAMQCLDTTDERITAALLPKIEEIWTDGTNIRAYLLALTHVPGHAQEKISVANRVLQRAPNLQSFAYALKATVDSDDDRRQDFVTLTQLDVNEVSLSLNIITTLPRSESLAVAMISSLRFAQTKQTYRELLTAIIQTLPLNSAYWGNVANEIAKQDAQLQAVYMSYVTMLPRIPAPLTAAALYLLTASNDYDAYFAETLGRSALDQNQITALANLAQTRAQASDGLFARWILSRHADAGGVPRIRGPVLEPICEVQGSFNQCRYRKAWLN